MNNFITFTIYFYQCLKHQLNICVEYKLLNVATKLLLKKNGHCGLIYALFPPSRFSRWKNSSLLCQEKGKIIILEYIQSILYTKILFSKRNNFAIALSHHVKGVYSPSSPLWHSSSLKVRIGYSNGEMLVKVTS